MKKAIITYTRPSIFGSGVDTHTSVIEDADAATFYARVTGAMSGIVGYSNPMNNAITHVELLEV